MDLDQMTRVVLVVSLLVVLFLAALIIFNDELIPRVPVTVPPAAGAPR